MKLLKSLLAIAIVSLIAVSCNDTKKGAEKDLKEAVEATKEVANDAVEATKDAAESVAESAGDVADSVEETAKEVADDVTEAAKSVVNWIDEEVVYPRDTKLQKQVIEIKAIMAKNNPNVNKMFSTAYGYAIFPKITKGGLIVGGAGGHGLVFEGNTVIGESTLMQATVGAQIGGQQYSEFILFQNKAALDRFKNKKFKFAGEVSAVAWDKAASDNVNYQNGVAVYTYSNKGLMAEISAGTQKFNYKAGIK